MLEHGGRLRQAANAYGIARATWLDLSTGINPLGYPLGAPPDDAWQRLPEDDDGLDAAAAAYYNSTQLLLTAGSQAVIQTLPRLLSPRPVAVLTPTYAEHPHHWTRAGHHVSCCTAAGLEDAARTAAVLVVCSPNNPDGTRISPARLTALAEKLAARDGLLVLDEAFIDATPAQSLTAIAGSAAAPNLIVLRSLGKFFGLAGARVGVVAAAATWRAALREALGPWPLSGPARWAAARAWADADWQGRTRTALAASSIRLDQILRPLGECVATPLFCWLPRQQPRALFDALARRGILTRCFDAGDTAGIRIGLPGKSADWMRLAGNIDTLKDFHR